MHKKHEICKEVFNTAEEQKEFTTDLFSLMNIFLPGALISFENLLKMKERGL